MRYDPTEYEWASIKSFLPNKPRGVPRVNDGACSTARIDDPIDASIADFLRGEIETELLAHHPGEEPAHRVLLPISCRHDGGDGRALGASQHGDHLSLLRVRPDAPPLPRVFFGRTVPAGRRLSRRMGSTFSLAG